MNKRTRTGAFAGLIMAAAFVASLLQRGRQHRPVGRRQLCSRGCCPDRGRIGRRRRQRQSRHDGRHAVRAACAAVPATGAGSFSGHGQAIRSPPRPPTTPPSRRSSPPSPRPSLGDTLNGAKDITVFAPANDAFAAMDKATLDAAMADPNGLLTKVLTYHVVQGRLTPEMLAGYARDAAGRDADGDRQRRGLHGQRHGQGRLRQRPDGQRHGLHHRRRPPPAGELIHRVVLGGGPVPGSVEARIARLASAGTRSGPWHARCGTATTARSGGDGQRTGPSRGTMRPGGTTRWRPHRT